MNENLIGNDQLAGTNYFGAQAEDDGDQGQEMGGDESEEEDEYYENPVDLIEEFGTHPLMEKAQI